MKVNKAVILAAGKGTRFMPYTKAHPKEMLAVIDRPSLQLIVEEVVASGIKEILLVISHEKEDIRKYFERDDELIRALEDAGKREEATLVREISGLAKIDFIYQEVPNGTGKAVLLAKEWANGEPFVVLNGDDVVFGAKPATKQLVEAYEQTGGSVVGVQPVGRKAVSAYASCKVQQVKGRLYRLEDIIEKPQRQEDIYSLLAPMGRYLFTSEIFDEIERAPMHKNEVYVTDAIRSLTANGNVFAYDFEGARYDFGDKLGYIKGFTAYALNSKKIGDDYKKFLQEILKEQKGDKL